MGPLAQGGLKASEAAVGGADSTWACGAEAANLGGGAKYPVANGSRVAETAEVRGSEVQSRRAGGISGVPRADPSTCVQSAEKAGEGRGQSACEGRVTGRMLAGVVEGVVEEMAVVVVRCAAERSGVRAESNAAAAEQCKSRATVMSDVMRGSRRRRRWCGVYRWESSSVGERVG